jgi:D-alanine transfer protein
MLCAMAVVAALLGGVRMFVRARLPGRLPYYAAYAMSFKVNGNVLQRLAFRTPDELPIYGSSELDYWADHRADAFFRARPTGFAVFPVGRGGATSLMILQKLAAVGDAARGKRVVIFLSPSWFAQDGVAEEAVKANLSGSQLSAWVFGGDLSPALKTDLARRLRDFPGALEDQGLSAAALQCLAEPTPLHRWGLALLTPLGKLQNAFLDLLDYGVIDWEMVFPQRRWAGDEHREPPVPLLTGGRIDWDRLLAPAGGDDPKRENGPPPVPGLAPGKADRALAARLQTSREFDDLALLVRVVRELQMKAYFISQPFDGGAWDQEGVTAQTRRVYYERLETMLRAAGYPLRDFPEHEEDRLFFNKTDHPSAKAWLFYDRQIDRFHAGLPD